MDRNEHAGHSFLFKAVGARAALVFGRQDAAAPPGPAEVF